MSGICFVLVQTVSQDGRSCLSEEFVQAYSLADSIRTWMVRPQNLHK